MATMVIVSLVENGLISHESKEEEYKIVRGNEKLGSLLEFSRSIHAEMKAIISAIHASGTRLIGSVLYSTTYPCHSCARHIVAAGISTVYFIEPYRKSLAIRLHEDSVTENEEDLTKLRILMYEGVAPRKYLSLFGVSVRDSRKQNGRSALANPKKAHPVISNTPESIPILESLAARRLYDPHLIGGGKNGEAF